MVPDLLGGGLLKRAVGLPPRNRAEPILQVFEWRFAVWLGLNTEEKRSGDLLPQPIGCDGIRERR